MATTDYLLFAGTATNILALSSYQTQAPAGNPLNMTASSSLNNRALKQASDVANAFTQSIADYTNTDITDTSTTGASQIKLLFKQAVPNVGWSSAPNFNVGDLFIGSYTSALNVGDSITTDNSSLLDPYYFSQTTIDGTFGTITGSGIGVIGSNLVIGTNGARLRVTSDLNTFGFTNNAQDTYFLLNPISSTLWGIKKDANQIGSTTDGLTWNNRIISGATGTPIRIKGGGGKLVITTTLSDSLQTLTNSNTVLFDAVGSTTFTIPQNVNSIKATVVAAGGGAGGLNYLGTSPVAINQNAGGGGGTAVKSFRGLVPNKTLMIQVGAGGTGGTSSNTGTATAGGLGGASSVNSGTQIVTPVIATGGTGGLISDTNSGGGTGGTTSGIKGSNYDFSADGGSGDSWISSASTTLSSKGGSSFLAGSRLDNTSSLAIGLGGSGISSTAPFTANAGENGAIILEWQTLSPDEAEFTGNSYYLTNPLSSPTWTPVNFPGNISNATAYDYFGSRHWFGSYRPVISNASRPYFKGSYTASINSATVNGNQVTFSVRADDGNLLSLNVLAGQYISISAANPTFYNNDANNTPVRIISVNINTNTITVQYPTAAPAFISGGKIALNTLIYSFADDFTGGQYEQGLNYNTTTGTPYDVISSITTDVTALAPATAIFFAGDGNSTVSWYNGTSWSTDDTGQTNIYDTRITSSVIGVNRYWYVTGSAYYPLNGPLASYNGSNNQGALLVSKGALPSTFTALKVPEYISNITRTALFSPSNPSIGPVEIIGSVGGILTSKVRNSIFLNNGSLTTPAGSYKSLGKQSPIENNYLFVRTA